MSNEDRVYKTVQGFVYAGPWDRDANGKKVRDFMISDKQLAGDVPVRVTLWPSHEMIDVAIGDYIFANGAYDIFPSQNEEGEMVNKHSCSVNKFINVGNGLGSFKDRGLANAGGAVSQPGKVKRVVSTDIPGL